MRRRLQVSGLQVDWQPQDCVVTDPAGFAQLFPATGGALYGRASHGWMASFRRPAAATALPGLFLAGGSVHPGPGVPMAALSGRLAAESLLTSAFRRGGSADGYRWWYLDALSSDARHGLTIIGFVGSVFSPYYAWARRKGPADADNHCALNVALYGDAGHRWSMTERGARHVKREEPASPSGQVA